MEQQIQSARNTSTESLQKSLSMILKEQPYLYDLHTHLLGMGNPGFWIDTILMDKLVMPTNTEFKTDQRIREALCPLVWQNANENDRTDSNDENDGTDETQSDDTDENDENDDSNEVDRINETYPTDQFGFINNKLVAKFFHFLVKRNVFRRRNEAEPKMVSFEKAIKPLKTRFPSVLWKLIDKKLYKDLKHGGLEFKEEFSYDVILTLKDLCDGLGVTNSGYEGFAQLAIREKLGCHLPNRAIEFRNWIIFNAKKQKFEIVYGMPLEQLRNLIYINPNEPNEAARLARAHVINAFSMCDAEGTPPRSIDFHSFHGCFTPEFYPRRFALKDSIYSQRLDVLAALISHVVDRYRTCLPPVKYCELSISANDLSKQWVFDVLSSVRIYDEKTIQRVQETSKLSFYTATAELSSFSQIVLNGCFPYLQVAFKGPTDIDNKNITYTRLNVTYKFLAGFDRRKITEPFPTDPGNALHLLYYAPHEAILSMMKEINKSQYELRRSKESTSSNNTVGSNVERKTEEGFNIHLKQLKDIIKMGKEVPWFYTWIVGIDLFGDELGYPYCSFVASPFIKFVRKQRKINKYFGMRVHGGENVKYINDESPAYRVFITHMYIVFRCLLFLQQKLKYGIRVGHGIAFNCILNADLTSARHRKSSVLLAEMQNHAYYLFKKIAFEVNLTSNEYLLGQTLRGADFARILRLEELFKLRVPIVLATDDDGIWPLDQCSSAHPGHHSLAAEYCRAISTSLIDTSDDLLWTFNTMKKFCFWDLGNSRQESLVKYAHSRKSPRMNSIIVHPRIISLILQEYKKKGMKPNTVFKNFKIYRKNTNESSNELRWTNDYGAQRVAFVCMCANRKGHNKEKLGKEYEELFDISMTPIKEFDFIYENWQNIFTDFVDCENMSAGGKIKEHDENEPKESIVWSIKSHSEDFDKFLRNIQWSKKEINIYAYINETNIKNTVETFERFYMTPNNNKSRRGTVLLFTNTDKYTYGYSKLGKKFKLQLNPHASKREITKDENFLYILCHHARAATAALNLISKKLSKFTNGSLTIASNEDKPVLFGSKNEQYLSDSCNPSEMNEPPSTTTQDVPDSFIVEFPNDPTTQNCGEHNAHNLS